LKELIEQCFFAFGEIEIDNDGIVTILKLLTFFESQLEFIDHQKEATSSLADQFLRMIKLIL
jgi:hypothetical protein